MKKELTPFQKRLVEFLVMTAGSAIVAVGVYFFKFPNHFSTGGVSGLSVLLGKVIPSSIITSSTMNSILNVIFLVLGFLVLDKGFGFRTIYCTVLYTGLVQVFEWVCPLTAPLTNQKMLELFFGILLPAIGAALLFHVDASTGGMDIVAMVLRKFSGLDVGNALLCSNVFIAFSALFIFDIETGLFSILGLALNSVVVDWVMGSLNRKKAFMVVTRNPESVCKFIIEGMNRSATIWDAKGAYTHHDEYVVLTVLSIHQSVLLRAYLRKTDPHAFILVTTSSEIFGKGFLSA
ncbi:MAG: YitT family protein [Oscillospiraceae bacterium]|nr:YitT family protein [Oscillospiraceae bacterium]